MRRFERSWIFHAELGKGRGQSKKKKKKKKKSRDFSIIDQQRFSLVIRIRKSIDDVFSIEIFYGMENEIMRPW